jgi:uncharacterized membrane protein YecN with MAPEG domain
MAIIPVTAITAALMGLMFIPLTARVIMARGAQKISLGDGSGGTVAFGEDRSASPLLVAVRAHGNFAENVPLCLVLMGIAEAEGAARLLMVALGVMLVVGRVMHVLGLGRPVPNVFRAGGVVLTFFVLSIASIAILWRVLVV